MPDDIKHAVSRENEIRRWEPPPDQLLPYRTRDLIAAAVRAASPPGRIDYYIGIFERMLPACDLFPDILGDAWETIAGDVDATHRFSERLRYLRTAQTCPRRTSDKPTFHWVPEDLQALRERLHERRRGAPDALAIIPIDHAALLIMATIHAGQGDAAVIFDNLSTVLDQLAAYDQLRPVLAEAYAALREDRAGADVLRALLDKVDEAWDSPSLHPGVPWLDVMHTPDLPTDQMQLDRWIVAAEALLAWDKVWKTPAFEGKDIWHKIQLSHSAACPGDLIFITSQGFGTKPGLVRFHVPPGKGQADILAIGPSSYVDVVPQAWTDTQIAVTIPQFASCGKFAIRIPTGTATIAGKTVDTYKNIGPIKIGGTLPEVIDLRANGVAGQLVCPPGTLVKLTWYACPDDAVVSLNVKVAGKNLWTKANLPPSGSEVLPVGAAKTTTYTVTLKATTVCGSVTKTLPVIVHKPAKLYLSSMEITQVTQYFGNGTTLPKTSNAVPLISGKTTLVRVYLCTTQDFSFNQSEITGAEVELRGWYEGGGELPGSPLSPITKGPFSGRNLGAYNDRKDLNLTANFLIPASWMLPGPTLRLQARVTLPQTSLDSVDTKNQYATLKGVRFHAAKPLDVVVVLVNHTGTCSPKYPNCQGTPTMADVAKTLHSVRRVYPTDKLRIWLPEPGDRILDFARDQGCGNCGSFSCLIDGLEDIAKHYDNDDDMVWWAAVKVGVGGPGGCGATGSSCIGYAASRVTDEAATWHEFGHAFGRPHTFADSKYPAYGFSKSYSIGEYAVDAEKLQPYIAANANKHLYSPYATADFMSYEPAPVFFSPYTYMALMQAHFAKSASGAGVWTSVPGALPRRDREERLVVCGTLWPETGQVELKTLYHMQLYPKDLRPQSTRFTLALVDTQSRTLVREALRMRDDGAEQERECNGALVGRLRISQTIPFHREAAAFVVRDGDRELVRVERPARGPSIEEVTLERGERWTLRWHSVHPYGIHLLHGVAITYDDGERWQRLAIALKGSSFRFEPLALAGGERCRLRIYVTDGFNTAYADSESFALPIRPPLVVLLDPGDGTTVRARDLTHLQAEAISPRFGSLDGEAIRWESDSQGVLGTGRELLVKLRKGEHRITVTAQTGPHSISQAQLSVRSV